MQNLKTKKKTQINFNGQIFIIFTSDSIHKYTRWLILYLDRSQKSKITRKTDNFRLLWLTMQIKSSSSSNNNLDCYNRQVQLASLSLMEHTFSNSFSNRWILTSHIPNQKLGLNLRKQLKAMPCEELNLEETKLQRLTAWFAQVP